MAIYLGSDIASQLHAAEPQDANYTIYLSDAKASRGAKPGDGYETRSLDLDYQKWAASNGDSSNVEQVIDYQKATVYQRFKSTDSWSRTSSKIAHYYDLQSPKVLGTETVNGVSAYHIRGTAYNDAQAFTMAVWARTDNLYPVQIFETFTIGSQTAYYLFVVTAYNTGVSVTVPTEVS